MIDTLSSCAPFFCCCCCLANRQLHSLTFLINFGSRSFYLDRHLHCYCSLLLFFFYSFINDEWFVYLIRLCISSISVWPFSSLLFFIFLSVSIVLRLKQAIILLITNLKGKLFFTHLHNLFHFPGI